MNLKEKLGQINFGYSLLLPGLLMGFFLISFILNQLSHYLFDPKNDTNTVRVQLPVDHTVVSIPKKITQSQSFEVSLQFATDRLARRINHIISTAAKGTTFHGITGVVSSNMSAEVNGLTFELDRIGPQPQLLMMNDKAQWTWQVLATEPGRHKLYFRLHLVSRDDGRENKHVVDIAQASIYTHHNTTNGLGQRMIWLILLLITLAIAWRFKYLIRH